MNSKVRWFLRGRVLDILGLFAKPANGIHILNGHMINLYNPDVEVFYSQLKKMQEFCTFIRIEDAVQLIDEHKTVNDVLVAFTFDDGYEECATMIAPALETYHTNALFFLNPNYVEGDAAYIKNFTENITGAYGKMPMRWNQINDLIKRGHKMGGHTLDHYMINSDDDTEIERQLSVCKTIIEEKTGEPCPYFAFPYGQLKDATAHTVQLAHKYYKYVFSQGGDKSYFSFNGDVINRRHFEPIWPINHVKYFISKEKTYEPIKNS